MREIVSVIQGGEQIKADFTAGDRCGHISATVTKSASELIIDGEGWAISVALAGMINHLLSEPSTRALVANAIKVVLEEKRHE